MLAMFNGQPIFGPRGPAGPDGNPIGTVISYMGTKAPTDYLICDGSVYNVSDYSKLAEFFKTQFGAENYFGGDGATTFAVPDMRNLFLRGYHNGAEEQLSGTIGVRQSATQHQNIYASGEKNSHFLYGPYITGDLSFTPQDVDTKEADNTLIYVPVSGISAAKSPHFYTSRPVNMAVLYCIKATDAESYDNVYSTEETRIGTWVDGKPIYRRVIFFDTITVDWTVATYIGSIENVDKIINTFGEYTIADTKYKATSTGGWMSMEMLTSSDSTYNINVYQKWTSSVISFYGSVTCEYTKTTDTGVST